MSYTNIFGGYNINTAFPSYMSYTFSGNLQLTWATSFVDNSNVTAQINDLIGTNITVNLANNPFTVTNGSAIVVVTIPSTGTLQTGNLVTIAGATDTHGITALQLNIQAPITVISATSFSFPSTGIATSSGTGGGSIVTYTLDSTITLADATLISVGQEIQFNNIGTNPITIFNFSGGQIATIPPTNNNQYILYLRNNTTQAGTWGITHLGAATSTADASALAGAGTIALNSEINTNFPGKTIGANYQVVLTDRASILVWTGGAGTITLPAQLAGFYIAVNNEGSGVVSINTPDGTTIDGIVSFPLNPSESSYFIGVSENWNTLGFGVESFFQVNVLTPIDLSAVNPSKTLTNQEASRLVEQYTGVLANNVTVYYPAAAGQWYIWNNTTGAFSVTAQLAGPTGNPIIVPQGEKVILYSDGNSMYNIPTIATSAVFPDGTVGAPGINFLAQNTTGFYRISSGLTGYASAGNQGLTFGGQTPGYGLGISEGLSSRYYNATNTNYVGFEAGALTANTTWTLPLTDSVGTQAMVSNGAGVLSWQTINPGTVTSVTGTAGQIDVANSTTTPVISIDAGYVGQTSITTLGTIATGIWNGTPVTVPHGGTGVATLTTAYGVVCAGTTAIGNLQNAGAGIANQAFISNGPAALPSWKSINALKADQQTATSTTLYANPAVQQYHPSAAKFWCYFNGTVTGTNPPISGYNVTSVIRNSVGNYTINFTDAFANANYVVNISAGFAGAFASGSLILGRTTSAVNILIINLQDLGATDAALICVTGFGTQ
jgi:hypothetical protein